MSALSTSPSDSARSTCLSLLLAMYPSEISYPPSSTNSFSFDVSLSHPPSTLSLSLPPEYPRRINASLRLLDGGGKQLEAALRKAMSEYLAGRGVADGGSCALAGAGGGEEEGDTFVAADLVTFLSGGDENAATVDGIIAEFESSSSSSSSSSPSSSSSLSPSSPAAAPFDITTKTISTSSPLVSKGSTFLASGCAISSPSEVPAIVDHLKASSPKMRRATHHMVAYRITTAGGTVFHDNDDDGEVGAGSKLSALLANMMKNGTGEEDVGRGALVVVSRWYGGVKLGPARWKLICNAAREAMLALGY